MNEYIWKDVRRWIANMYLVIGFGVFVGTVVLNNTVFDGAFQLLGALLIYVLTWPGILFAHFVLGAAL